jgi:MATE family multidrug resistance protein
MWVLQQPLLTLGLNWMGPEASVHSTAREYADLRIFGAPAALFNYVLIGWFVGNQNTRVPLILLTVINLINLVLDLLFVMGFGWGASGVAAATICAEYSGSILGLFLALKMVRELGGRVNSEALTHLRGYSDLFQVNKYLFVRTASLLFMFAFFTAQGARLGTDTLSANAILLNFLMLISHALDGFAHAAEAVCGRYAGAGQRDKFYEAVKACTRWSIIFALLLSLVFVVGGHQILKMMTDIESVLEVAYEYLPFIWLLPLIAVWSYLQDGILVGTTQSKAMLKIMLITVFVTFLPVWWITTDMGNTGLWIAFLAAFVARAATGFVIFKRFDRDEVWFKA